MKKQDYIVDCMIVRVESSYQWPVNHFLSQILEEGHLTYRPCLILSHTDAMLAHYIYYQRREHLLIDVITANKHLPRHDNLLFSFRCVWSVTDPATFLATHWYTAVSENCILLSVRVPLESITNLQVYYYF